MNFKVTQCIVTVEGVFNCGQVYNSDDYSVELINSMKNEGVIEDLSYLTSDVTSNLSFSNLTDVSVDITSEDTAGNVLIVDDVNHKITSLPRDYNNFENKPMIEVSGTAEEPLIVSDLETGIYRFSGFGKISPLSPTNEFSEYGVLVVSDEDTTKEVTCLYNGVLLWSIEKETGEYTIKKLISDEEFEQSVKWSYADHLNKKYIQLGNNENICGKSTKGTDYNLIQMSKWDAVDIGSREIPLILSTNGVVTIDLPASTENSLGRDFVATATKLYKIVIEADENSKYYPYNGQVIFNGALANYITATIVIDAEDNVTDLRIEVTGQVQ